MVPVDRRPDGARERGLVPDGWRSGRHQRRRFLPVVVPLLLSLVGGYLLVSLLTGTGIDTPAARDRAAAPAGGSAPPATFEQGRHLYALSIEAVRGLPPDAEPGTDLQLWVAWEPPVTRHTSLDQIVGGVTLVRMIPPVTPEGPVTALVAIEEDHAGDLLFADRYGLLSATVLPSR